MTETTTSWAELPGGRELIDWFAYEPKFHDAEISKVSLISDEESIIEIYASRMTSEVDTEGYFVSDRHVLVTLKFEYVKTISLKYFRHRGIIFEMNLTKLAKGFCLSWEGSYGVEGKIIASAIQISLAPGKRP